MALTGNLEVFPLQEVLRMLARSNKTGCLRVESGGLQGRMFIANGALTLATVGTDEEFRRQVLAAGLVTEEDLRRVDTSGITLSEALSNDRTVSDLTDFVREHVVESLYRVRKSGHGNFDFLVDVMPRFATGLTFDADVAVSESERRATEWSDIESVIPDLGASLSMRRDLPDENSVTIAPGTWRVLAALSGGASVSAVASILGMSTFRAARELAGLVRNGLVDIRSGVTFQRPVEPQPEPAPAWGGPAPEPVLPEPATEPAAPVWGEPAAEVRPTWGEPAAPEQPAWGAPAADEPPAWGEPAAPEQPAWGAPAADEQPAWGEPAEPAAPRGDSWSESPSPWAQTETPQSSEWDTAADGPDEAPTADGIVEEAPEPGSARSEEEVTGGWWAQAMGAPQSAKSDDDADAFLESVFSQLDEGEVQPSSDDSEETGFSMGLLRRRRMGAVSKDLTES